MTLSTRLDKAAAVVRARLDAEFEIIINALVPIISAGPEGAVDAVCRELEGAPALPGDAELAAALNALIPADLRERMQALEDTARRAGL